MSRLIDRVYADPLDLVWLAAARRLGWRVERSSAVFAAWDGQGTLTLSTPEHFDPDDSLGQLLFHEMCHALVEGPEAMARPDWGLCNRDLRHLDHEYAAHRLQAALAGRHGLRGLLAPTTEHRPYYDALPSDPLAEGPVQVLDPARAGWAASRERPWDVVLEPALQSSAALLALVAPVAPVGSVWRRNAGPARHSDGEAAARPAPDAAAAPTGPIPHPTGPAPVDPVVHPAAAPPATRSGVTRCPPPT